MSKLITWGKELHPAVQIAIVVAFVALVLAAMWFALPLDWLPGWLSS